ncbi:MAG: DUF4118 domain-containing protein [Bryobacterales bacterium]|nr:DUF4118 domain-containing protein [Bryobacterales bacterium]
MQKTAVTLRRRVLWSAFAVLCIGAVTAIDFRVIHANGATAAFTFLILILALATKAGLEASITASLAGMLAYNFFFLPPVGTLTIADPQNWVALCVFLVTAITASQLSTTARREAQEAKARRTEMERLYEFSRSLLLGNDGRSVGGAIVKRAVELFRLREAAFFAIATDTIDRNGETTLDAARLREVAASEVAWAAPGREASIVPIRIGGHSLGSLGVAGGALSEAALQAMAQMGAIALERARAQAAATREEATRYHERLKSTLLDAIAHDFKTPLTSIKAAVTSVLSGSSREPVQQEMLSVIDEETDRLTRLVDEAIEISRISAGDLHLQRARISVKKLVDDTLDELRGFAEERNIGLHLANAGLWIDADPKLSVIALRQLIDNALKYAPPAASISIEVSEAGPFAAIEVANEGPPISEREQDTIFEKFYRGVSVRERIPGTGMGLSITREIARAHGGALQLAGSNGKGVRFVLTLPLARPQRESA